MKMCILFIYTDPNPKVGGYRLIVASNRDEYYNRPAKDAFVCSKTGIMGGRDMEKEREGGMWLGFKIKETNGAKLGTFGALLNVTGEERKSDAQGRGFLVYDYLEDDSIDSKEYSAKLAQVDHKYNSYNLVTTEISKDGVCTYFHSNAPECSSAFDGRQTLAFGNSTLEVPLTKVKIGRDRFTSITEKNLGKENLVQELLDLLKFPNKNLPDPELQRRAPQTFDYLSSIYVHIENTYGTRTHSIILIDYDWNVDFIEYTMAPPINSAKPTWSETRFSAKL